MDDFKLGTLPSLSPVREPDGGVRGVGVWSVAAGDIGRFVESGSIDHLAIRAGERFRAQPFIQFWQMLVASHCGIIMLALEKGVDLPTGVLGGLVAPDPNNGILTCNLAFWSVSPDSTYRTPIMLFSEWEKWGKSCGASRLRPARCHEAIKDMDGFFRSQGYRVDEVRFVKDI